MPPAENANGPPIESERAAGADLGGQHQQHSATVPRAHGLLARWLALLSYLRHPSATLAGARVLAAILDRMNDAGEAWPGLGRLASDINIDRSTVVRAVGHLVELQFLERESGSRTESNRYRLGCEGRRTFAPRCSDAPRCVDAPGVGAPVRLEVGAPTHPELASLNLPKNLPKKTRARKTAPPLPDWIPVDTWEAWKRHRGKKLTAESQHRQITKLDQLRAAGNCPVKVIERSIEKGWSGLFGHEETRVGHKPAPQAARNGFSAPNRYTATTTADLAPQLRGAVERELENDSHA